MGIVMKEKAVGFQNMMAKSWVRLFLGITLLLFLVGLPGLYLLRSDVFSSFTARWILLAALTGITAFLLVIWVFNIGWYSVWYRYLVLSAARMAGFLVRMWRTYMERIILCMIILGVLIAAWQWLLPESLPVPKFLAWITFDVLLKILVVSVIMKISQAYLKLRKQIVLQKFKNLTGEIVFDVQVEAIQEVLINRFNHLKDLIYTIDEINPKSQDNRMPSPTINVSDAVDSLKNLDLPGQKIKVGTFFEIPLGFIVSSLRNILKGPILTGSLHKRGNDLELIAHMSSRRCSGSWRVTFGDLDEEEKKLPEKDRLEKMIEHLCCMIFTRLVSVGSNRWQAVHRYTEGLQAYRLASKKEKGKQIYLRQAEKAFIDALNEDKTFSLCRYNLGVVYEELGQDDSVEAAFRQVLRKDHKNADAYFNLGFIYFYKKKYEDALWYAEQALRLKAGDSRYWNMRGVIYDYIYDKVKKDNKTEEAKLVGKQNEQSIKTGEENEKMREKNIIKNNRFISFHIAAKLSWKSLCLAILRGENNLRLKNIARVCVSNLALVHDYEKKNRKIRLFKQSIAVSSGEGKPYFEIGKIFVRHDLEKALFAFDKVFEEDSTLSNSIAFWTLYAYACKKLIVKGKKNDYEKRCSNAKYHLVDTISENLDEFFDSLSAKYNSKSEDETGVTKLQIPEPDIKDGSIRAKFNDWVSKKLKEKLKEEDDWLEANSELEEDVDKWLKEEELWPIEKKGGENKQDGENKKKDWPTVQIDIFIAKGFIDQQIEIIRTTKSATDNKEKARSEAINDCINRLECAIDNLKENHEREIRIHRLYGLLAECYLNIDKSREREKREESIQKALFYARKAVEIDPLSAEERGLLSRAYFKLNDFQQALKELENCLVLTPDDSEILRYIPLIRNWDQVFFHDPEKRKNAFKSMCEFLERGILQIKSQPPFKKFDDQEQKDVFEYMNTIYFKLGNFHRKLKNYDEAITYLKIAETIGGRDALKAKIDQGWTFIEARDFNKAEQVFDELYRYNEKFYPIEVCLGLAVSIIERTISAHGENDLFEVPNKILEEVKERLVESENEKGLKNIKPGEYRWYRAQYYGCLGRIALNIGEIEKAVKHFEKSVSINASCWGYYFLAEAFYRRSQEIKRGKECFYLERAHDACILSEKFDKNDLYRQEVTALKQKITDALKGLKIPSPGENSRGLKKYKVIEEK